MSDLFSTLSASVALDALSDAVSYVRSRITEVLRSMRSAAKGFVMSAPAARFPKMVQLSRLDTEDRFWL